MTDQFSTLYQLLDTSDTQYRVFDLGRRVQKISQSDFEAFENAQLPYPYPLQQKAWLAILFWDKARSNEHYLWFLNFPLDEQGKLIQATRNHFIAMVIEVLGTQLTNNNNGEQQEKLDNNPYTFKPDQTKLASLNAQIKVQMNQPASIYYEHAQSYLQGTLGWQDWQSVGIQGLADVAARIDDNASDLLNALAHIPEEVETPLCSLLEHSNIPTPVAEALLDNSSTALKNNHKQSLINGLRALSNSKAVKIRQTLLQQVLTSNLATDQEVLLVITARCWLDLQDDGLRLLFLEKLAEASPDQQLFQGIVADLVAIPAIRTAILQSFRSPERSATLATAIGHLFGQHQSSTN